MLFEPIPRREGVSRRMVGVGLFGRFTDELLIGIPNTLMPTIARVFGLSVVQVNLLWNTLDYVAAFVEPTINLLSDVWQRKWIMVMGAIVLAVAVILMGIAPTFIVLLIAFGLYGVGSGPLAHSADIILVSTHPEAPDRIFARATLIDYIGAILAPMLVTAVVWLDLEWRWLLISVGICALWYGWIIGRTQLPNFKDSDDEDEQSLFATLRTNIQTVTANKTAQLWLGVMLLHELFETPFLSTTIWLHDSIGMSQALIGIYVSYELAIGFVGLTFLDRWRKHFSAPALLQLSVVATLFLYPLWILVPAIWMRFVVAVPLHLLYALQWPIARSQSLASVPEHEGTISALTALFGLIPLKVLFALLATQITLTYAMLVVQTVAMLFMFLIVRQIVIRE